MNEISTREQYLGLFDSTAQAVEFDEQCLAIGRTFLPVEAQAVRDGAPATAAYWQWLAGQLAAS